MFTAKSNILADAPAALNKPGQPWEVQVKGDALVARWIWEDASYIVNHEIKSFTFTATLYDQGKWKERELYEKSFPGGKSAHLGKTSQKTIEFSLGRNKDTGKPEIGEVSTMDTAIIKSAIRDYLTSHGWKKAKFFEKL